MVLRGCLPLAGLVPHVFVDKLKLWSRADSRALINALVVSTTIPNVFNGVTEKIPVDCRIIPLSANPACVVSLIVSLRFIVEAPFSDAGVGAPVGITFRFALGFEDSVVAEVVGVLPLAGLSVPLRIDIGWILRTVCGASASILDISALGPGAQVIIIPARIVAYLVSVVEVAAV